MNETYELAANPQFWLLLGGTLFYCGILALFAGFGWRTANWLQNVAPTTTFRRVVRKWQFWFVPAMLLFILVMLFAMADAPFVCMALMVPYAYFTAVGIYREKCV
jgi:hypothetical protein